MSPGGADRIGHLIEPPSVSKWLAHSRWVAALSTEAGGDHLTQEPQRTDRSSIQRSAPVPAMTVTRV